MSELKSKKSKKNSTVIMDCPVRTVLDRIGDKWSILILLTLGRNDTLRFNEIYKEVGFDISQKMLTVTLRSLESDGLISRKVYPEVPPRVEYKLTDLGNSLIPHIKRLVDWAEESIDSIKASRKKYAK